jgi:hypothetical protein
MFVYIARRYFSTRTGTRIVNLQCERCGCEYHFQLHRVGAGQPVPFSSPVRDVLKSRRVARLTSSQ